MRTTHLLPAILFLLACVMPADAIDPSKIDRTLKDHPVFQSGSPRFCLLVFGPQAKTRVWLVHDGDVLHVRASPDGKSPATWRQVKNVRYGAPIGDVWEEGGKIRHTNLRYVPWGDVNTLSVRVGGKEQIAGHDHRGQLEFAADPEDAPVVHFNGPLALDLWYEQRPLWHNRRVNITAVVGTHGLGKGTFALFQCNAYPPNAWPTAVIEYPAKGGGKPIVVTTSLADE
jgi:hypothetical protein